MKMSLQVEE